MSKHLLISWLQSLYAVILEPFKIKCHIGMKRQKDMTLKHRGLKQLLFYLPVILFCGLGSVDLASAHAWNSIQWAVSWTLG